MTNVQTLDHIRMLTGKVSLPEKSQQELNKALLKWFAGHVLKSLTLSGLRAIDKAGAYAAFEELLRACSNVERVTVLGKLDKFRPEIQMYSTSDAMAHMRKLVQGDIEPAPKPAAISKSKPRASSKSKTGKRGILTSSKY
jgi:hypothetical protein